MGRLAVGVAVAAAPAIAWIAWVAANRLDAALGFLAGASAALVATWLVGRPPRRPRTPERWAAEVCNGDRPASNPVRTRNEIARIGAELSRALEALRGEKRAVAELNAELDARVERRTRHVHRLSAQASRIGIARERLRLARDLHDTLANSVMALLTQLRMMRKLHAGLSRAELERELECAERVAGDALREVRDALTGIRDGGVREPGLEHALHELVEGLRARARIDVELSYGLAPDALGEEVAEAVLRVVEAALHNVERHAGATRVRVRAVPAWRAGDGASTRAGCRVEIVDDGGGFDPSARIQGRYGVVGMHEQAALVGGSLSVRSGRGEGTRIVLRVGASHEAVARAVPGTGCPARRAPPRASLTRRGSRCRPR